MAALTLRGGMRILFQGDSITDCGRRQDERGLGGGYVSMVAASLSERAPDGGVTFINRGISGNRARDVRARWERDCVELKPDLVSVLIGINDTWRRYDSNDPTSTEAFREDYTHILEVTRDRLGVPIVLCEPFLLPLPEDRVGWREDLDPKIAVVRDLARAFATVLVPLDGIFAAASVEHECAHWTRDGVHPTGAGHELISRNWVRCVFGVPG
jgi:lysophospholipase L1-like esterase